MMIALNETHNPAQRSFVASANTADSEFPIQNLPFGVFRPAAGCLLRAATRVRLCYNSNETAAWHGHDAGGARRHSLGNAHERANSEPRRRAVVQPVVAGFIANPYPFYHRLRATDPMHLTPLGFYVASRHADIIAILRDKCFGKDFVGRMTRRFGPRISRSRSIAA